MFHDAVRLYVSCVDCCACYDLFGMVLFACLCCAFLCLTWNDVVAGGSVVLCMRLRVLLTLCAALFASA